MKKGKLGVCIIGCGFMGNKHAACWDANPEAEIVSVVDIQPERAQRMAELYGLNHFYMDYPAAVDRPDVDVVSVCTPTCFHAEHAIYAMAHGKHVLSEKPVALLVKDAEAMQKAAEKYGGLFGVGFMRRYSPVVDGLREHLRSGSIGRPVLYTAADIREQRPKVEMHDAQANGGPVIDMSVHLIDLWTNIFESPPVSVFAQGLTLADNQRPGLEDVQNLAPDTAVLTVRYASGDIGTFQVSWGLPPGVTPPVRPDQVYGPGGLLEAEYEAQHQQVRGLQPGGQWQILFDSQEDMYQREIDHFARAILHDEPLLAGGQEGIQALQVARAALDSLRTGKVIML